MVLPPPEGEFFTDASLIGWGAHLVEFVAQGLWDPVGQQKHINELELEAVCLFMKELQTHIPRGHLRIVSDNATVVAYINSQRGTVSPRLSEAKERLLIEWHGKGVSLSSRHLADVSNVLADFLNRQRTIVQTNGRFLVRFFNRFGNSGAGLW